jgi:asparagine synthase (glutamine-hydrolysing)
LSGGIDSSTVCGILTCINQRPTRTYSIGFDAEAYNETEYARLAANHFGTRHSEYYVTDQDVVDAVPRVAQFCDEPFGNSSAVAVYYCARMAKEDGSALLLAGDGGDELFAGHVRYARQKIFEIYPSLPSLLRQSLIEPIIFRFPGGERITFVHKARSYIKHARTALPERREIYNFLQGAELTRIFKPDFLASIDSNHPLMLLQDVYNQTQGEPVLNRLLHLDWKFTLADDDLRKVNRMCELAGIDVRYPLLDDQLVEFSVQLPASLKLKRLQLRYFFKQAMKDFLPPEILRKSKHGFGLPFNLWLRSSVLLQELAYDSIHDLRKRNYFRPAFLDQLTGQHKSESDGSSGGKLWSLMMQRIIQQSKPESGRDFGDIVWILMMLELWLQTHTT